MLSRALGKKLSDLVAEAEDLRQAKKIVRGPKGAAGDEASES
jgi:hypothetical protein